MLTLRAELTDLTQVSAESQRLHGLLQASVDRELQQPGWLPPGNGHSQPERWHCSPKQQALILRIVDEQRLDKNDIEQLAQERFGKGVKQLNTLDASGLIEEMFEKYPRPRGNGRSFALA
ncbi:MAG: hypothetical protein RL514_1234 [Verrucomicrobiota bacterium]|jgi:hypothetical protein